MKLRVEFFCLEASEDARYVQLVPDKTLCEGVAYRYQWKGGFGATERGNANQWRLGRTSLLCCLR